jgi:hypothetical protein
MPSSRRRSTRRSAFSRVRNYYRMFRLHSGPVRSLYFAISLAL